MIATRTLGKYVLIAFMLAPAFAGASPATVAAQTKPVEYKVVRTIDGRKEGAGLYLFISIAPEDFSRERMTQLARQLNHDYPDEKKLDASIFDSETTALNVLPAGHEYTLFKKAERGLYHLDRAKGVESLHFSTKPGRPSNEIKLNLTRRRPRSSSHRLPMGSLTARPVDTAVSACSAILQAEHLPSSGENHVASL